MAFQYIIVTVIVAGFIAWQFYSFRSNRKRIGRIKQLFPDTDENNIAITSEEHITTICNEDASGDFKNTLEDINKYLSKNENKTFDYQIIKEIVERNAQSLDEEVNTMLSAPLYLGLMATILGIVVGVVAFAWDGLAGLLSDTEMNTKGIQVMLTDVGIAMCASLVGVFCTKWSTNEYNDAKTLMTKNKNVFLTWVQSDLMSKLNDNITGALLKMTNDLNRFNKTFSDNTKDLKEALGSVNNNYKEQVKLFETIDRLKITKIAQANIDVYDKLKGCTDELEKLFEILSNSEEYVSRVAELNRQLASVDKRTQLFEELGNYFKNEIEYVKDRQGMMRQQMSGLDAVLQDALSDLGDGVKKGLQDFIDVFQKQNQSVQALIESQQKDLKDALDKQHQEVNNTISSFENPFEGLNNIFISGVKGITEAFETQNTAIKEMLDNQKKSVEDEIAIHQKVLLKKLEEVPEQLRSLSNIEKVLVELNQSIKNLDRESAPQIVQVEKTGNDKKMITRVLYILAGGFCGVFFALVILIVIILFGIKL